MLQLQKPVAVAFAAALVVAAQSVPASAAEPAVVKIGSHTPEQAKHMRVVIKPWMRKIEKDSDGTLVFKEFWGGSLIRSPAKQYEAMMNGIQDASPVLPSYTQKLFPDFGLFALPYMFRDSTESSVAMWKMYEKGMIGGLGRVYVSAVYSNDNSGLHFTKTFKSIEDIKGTKIRAAGPEEAAIIKAVGAIPVGVSITEVAESLNRGVIQGTMNGWSALQSFRITPLIRTHLDAPFGVRTFFMGITKKVYDKLPVKARAAIDANSGLAFSRALGADFDADGNGYRVAAAKDSKRVVLRPTGPAGAQLEARMRKFHDEWIRTNKDGKKKYDALQAILADLRKAS